MTGIPDGARALTVRQPWASLIALGVKTIETRGWRTDYRGPLVIHAGKVAEGLPARGEGGSYVCDRRVYVGRSSREFFYVCDDGIGHRPLPLGAVVAVVDLVDVVPVVDHPLDRNGQTRGWVEHDRLTIVREGHRDYRDATDQLPFGDFTPGRYAWLLDNVRPIDPPIPAKGRQGLWMWQP